VRILLSNDDGHRAAGLIALRQALQDEHELVVCAPAGECSATGHGLTLREPLRLQRTTIEGCVHHGLAGLPADAVKFGLGVLCAERPPDLVISGINHGANTGQNLFYSGTVAAAAEGVFAGIPSIALSLAAPGATDFSVAAAVARELVARFAAAPFPPDTLLNVNVPALPGEQIRGWRLSRMGHARFHERFFERRDPGDRPYWWMDGAKNGDDEDPEHDDHQVHAGWITVTPCRLDLTHPDWRQLLAAWNLETP
jgi:5'-nucleotidase